MRSTRPRYFRGFTLIELLVVCAIIVAVLGIGVVSASGMLARNNVRQAEQTVVSAVRLARQHAIATRRRCMLELVVINDHTGVRPTAPGTPYERAHEGDADKLRIYSYSVYRNPETGLREHLVQPVPLREFALPPNVVFDDEKGERRFYPDNGDVRVDYNRDGKPDPQAITKIFFDFHPDGTCTSRAPMVSGQEARNNVIGLRETVTGETSAVCVLPSSVLIRKP